MKKQVKNMKSITLVLFTVFCSLISFAQTNEKLFALATDNYQKGQCEEAIRQYQQIIARGSESSALYYNMANAYYKLNKVPESIYYYEKALKLDPKNTAAKNNLTFAKQMTVDAITPLPKTWLQQLSDSITGLFELHTWAILSIIAIWGVVVFFLCYYFVVYTALKRTFFTLLLVTIVIAIGTYSIAHYKQQQIANEQYAILFEKTVRIFAEPNAYSSDVLELHEGTKVAIVGQENDWLQIQLANGKTGWTKSSNLKKL